MRIVIFFILQVFFSSILTGQSGQGTRASIMVVPWTSADEDLREKTEADFNYRAILNEVRAAFDAQGYTTVNFIQKLRNLSKNEVVGLSNWRTVFKDIIDNSGADIIIQTEINVVAGKYGNSVNLLLEAVETSSSESLANSGLLRSESYSTEDYAYLAKNALQKEQAIEKFLNSLNEEFRTLRTMGRSIVCRVEVEQDCIYDLNTSIGNEGDYLSDLIQDWVENKCESWRVAGLLDDSYYNIEGNGPSLLSFDFIRIPFSDENGKRYDINNYARELRKAVTVLGIKSEKGTNFSVKSLVDRNRLTLVLVN